MNSYKLNAHKKVALAAAIGAMFVSGIALAETASDTVDANAGLQPVMELTCTDVSFGVWRVPVRTTGGTTVITLDAAANTVTPSVNTTQVAQSLNGAWAHNRGTCTLSGSSATESTSATVTYTANLAKAFTGANAAATGFTNLDAPAVDATLTADITGPVNCTIDVNGECSFFLGGVLTIPEAIIADNYGGYRTSGPATVEVEDGV